MKTEPEIRQALRDWVVKTNGKIGPDRVSDQTAIIEQRIINSLHIMDLILFIEKESGRSIDVRQLKVGVFRNIDTIYKNFFQGVDDGR